MYQLLNYDDLFKNFTERADELKKVTRFKIYKPMYYRSNLVTHSKHVFWLLQNILPLIYKQFGNNFDATKAQIMAAVHDDPETIMGDVEGGIKRKMSPEQMAELDAIELRAIDELSKKWPKTILGYSYKDLMCEAVGQKTIEAQIGKFVDKFDAHGETLHEIYAGNRAFITPITNAWGTIDLPAPFYAHFLKESQKKLPLIAPLYVSQHDIFTPPKVLNYEQIVSTSSPHTTDNIKLNTGCRHYEFWKKVILDSTDVEEIKNLTEMRETV